MQQFEQFILRDILDKVPCSVFWKDLDGKYLGCNRYTLDLAKMDSIDDIIGKTDYDLRWKAKADQFWENDQYVIKHDHKITLEEEMLLENGEQRFFLNVKYPLKNKKGKIIGVFGTAIDITDKKHVQELEEKSESIQLTAASIAHELRTPLSAINMGIKSLQRINNIILKHKNNLLEELINEGLLPHQAEDSLSNIPEQLLNEIKYIFTNIDMLITRISDIDTIYHPTTVELSELVTEAIGSYPMSPETRSIIELNLDSPISVITDKVLLTHVIYNLIKNAVYFVEKAGGGNICLSLTQKDSFAEFIFTDTGTGISSDTLPHIFELFYSKDTHHGTGVGLAFCKLVIEKSEGTIESESVLGDYTRFIIRLPIAADNINSQ